MEKISKVSLPMLALMLSIFMVAGTASAWSPGPADPNGHPGCYTDGCAANGNIAGTYECGDVVECNCTLNADMDCSGRSTKHGLIIGAPDITIDGAGRTIDGGGTDNRDCAVNVYHEAGDAPHPPINTRMWCSGHPCRKADLLVNGVGDNNPLTSNGCLDSGVINATVLNPAETNPSNPTLALLGGCNAAAPVGQGGCDNVTIQNLEITGWCDGIWISGDCDTGVATSDPRYGRPGYADHSEYRLTGIVVEGNVIHDNGKDGCGDYTACPAPFGDGGDWENRYYNDAIFTAQIGLDAANSPEWAVADGLPVDEYVLPVNDGINGGNKTFYCWWSALEVEENNAKPNHIIHNDIWKQAGCGCVACAGGMGINLQGGLEDPSSGIFIWSGGNNIGSNNIRCSAMSGISHTHASRHNRIHHNYCLENKFGGITAGCGWNHENYLFCNVIEHNDGLGIGQASSAIIEGNRVVSTHAVSAASELHKLGWPDAGYGILLGPLEAGDPGSVVEQNYVSVNQAADILDNSGVATGSRNACVRAGTFGPGCDFCGCPPFASLCKGDVNKNGQVNNVDQLLVTDELGAPCRQCAPGVSRARCPIQDPCPN